MFAKPEKLSHGSRVGIIIPASPVKEPFRKRGLRAVRDMGFIPVETQGKGGGNGYLAKPSEENIADIQGFLDDPTIDAVWAARGGYGSNVLLPGLGELRLSRPKVLIGSSDVSYLLWFFLDRLGLTVIYGPMAFSSLADGTADTDQLLGLVSGREATWGTAGIPVRPGNAEGVLTGGCLSNLVSLVGTPHMPVLRDRLVLFEDRGERPYRLDRMIWQLVQARAFEGVRALVLGEFPGCFKNRGEKEQFLHRVADMTREQGMPVISDLPFGHARRVRAVPLGVRCRVRISAGGALLEVLEPAVI
jgi:muramoyltetrapeptide carboxypeptidase